MCAADVEDVGGVARFLGFDKSGPYLNREWINGRLSLIVRMNLHAVMEAQSPEARDAAVDRLVQKLITHVDETVDAALAFADDEDTPY